MWKTRWKRKSNFLNSITLEELEEVCYQESLDVIQYEDALQVIFEDKPQLIGDDEEPRAFSKQFQIGCSVVSLEETSIKGIFQCNIDAHQRMFNTNRGFKLNAYLTQNLKTVKLEKYEYCQRSGTTVDTRTELYTKSDGTCFMVQMILVDGKQEDVKFIAIPEEEGILTEAAVSIFERILSLRKYKGPQLNFKILDDRLNICNLRYSTKSDEHLCWNGKKVEVFLVIGVMRNEKGKYETVTWSSYFHNLKKYLLLRSVDDCLVYLTSKDLPSDDLKTLKAMYSFLSPKDFITTMYGTGKFFLHSIRKNEWSDLLFSEMKVTNYFGHHGYFTVTIEKSFFKGKPCLLVLHSSQFNDGLRYMGYSCTSYMDFQLRTLDYQEQRFIQGDDVSTHIIANLYRDDDKCFKLKTTNTDGTIIFRQNSHFSKHHLDDFISPAALVLLERLFVKRQCVTSADFTTLIETMLAPLKIRQFPNGLFSCENSGTVKSFVVDCSISPSAWYRSCWRDHFATDYQLIRRCIVCENDEAHMEVRCSSHSFQLPCPEIDVFSYVPVYRNGFDFLWGITVSDLDLVSFSETLKVKTKPGIDDGLFNMNVITDMDGNDVIVKVECNGSAQDADGAMRHLYLRATLTATLETLEQVIKKTIVERRTVVYHSEINVKMCGNEYEIRSMDNTIPHEWKISSEREGMPFISDAAELVLERLLIRKNFSDHLYFFNIDNSLSIWITGYSPLRKKWKTLDKGKLEVFGIQKMLYLDYEFDSFEEIFCTKTGLCVERKIFDEFAEVCYILSGLETLENLTIQDKISWLMPNEISSHDPLFSMCIDKREIKYILFTDDISILAKDDKEIGHVTQKVSHVYHEGQDAYLVQLAEWSNDCNGSNGTKTTAYINCKLEILQYSRCQYQETTDLKKENIVTISREPTDYLVHSIIATNNEVVNSSEKWKFSGKFSYTCDATRVLIARLMILRNFQTVLQLTDIDEHGHEQEVELIPEGMSFLSTYAGLLPVIGIKTNLHQPNNLIMEIFTKFSRSGFIVQQHKNDSEMNFYNTNVLNSFKTPNLCESVCSPLYIPSNTASINILQSFSHTDIQSIFTEEELIVMTEDDQECGTFSLIVKPIMYKNNNCISAVTDLSFDALDKCKSVITVSDILSFKLQLLNHEEIHIDEENGLSVKRIHAERLDDKLQISHKDIFLKDRKEDVAFIKTDIDGFVTDASLLIFLKLMAQQNEVGILKFNSINSDGVICETIVRCVGHMIKSLDGEEQTMFVTEIAIIPYKQCLTLFRMFFSYKGSLLYCGPVGNNMYMKRSVPLIMTDDFALDANTESFFEFIGSTSHLWPDICFPDHFNLYTTKGKHIGEVYMFINRIRSLIAECVYFSSQQRLYEALPSFMYRTDAITSYDLETFRYIFSSVEGFQTDSAVTKIISVYKQEYGYKVIKSYLSRLIDKKNISYVSEEIPRFYYFGLIIIIMRLMMRLRQYNLHFVAGDARSHMFNISIECLENKKTIVFGSTITTWKMCVQLICRTKPVGTYVFYVNENGKILVYQDFDITTIHVVHEKEAKNMAERQVRALEQSISEVDVENYLSANEDVKATIKNAWKDILMSCFDIRLTKMDVPFALPLEPEKFPQFHEEKKDS